MEFLTCTIYTNHQQVILNVPSKFIKCNTSSGVNGKLWKRRLTKVGNVDSTSASEISIEAQSSMRRTQADRKTSSRFIATDCFRRRLKSSSDRSTRPVVRLESKLYDNQSAALQRGLSRKGLTSGRRVRVEKNSPTRSTAARTIAAFNNKQLSLLVTFVIRFAICKM